VVPLNPISRPVETETKLNTTCNTLIFWASLGFNTKVFMAYSTTVVRVVVQVHRSSICTVFPQLSMDILRRPRSQHKKNQ
jgi:hypothetical protein